MEKSDANNSLPLVELPQINHQLAPQDPTKSITEFDVDFQITLQAHYPCFQSSI